jgi:hypothetical protein
LEQQLWSECSRLLANCIIYYNACILSELLERAERRQDYQRADAIKRAKPASWKHVNLYVEGELEFEGELEHGEHEFLDMPAPEPPDLEPAKDYRERYQELIGTSLWVCPLCHQGRMLVIEILPRSPHRKPAIADTS